MICFDLSCYEPESYSHVIKTIQEIFLLKLIKDFRFSFRSEENSPVYQKGSIDYKEDLSLFFFNGICFDPFTLKFYQP